MRANTIDSSPNGYVLAAAPTPGSQIMQWHISGPPRNPTMTQDGIIAVPAYQMPPTIPQPGTRFRLDSRDGLLTQAVAAVNPLAGGQLTIWTQHTIQGPAPDRRSVARWYELIPATLSVHQTGTVQVPGQYVFNAAVSPSGGAVHDDAAIIYNVAGMRLRPQIRASSQEDFGTPNQMGAEVTLGTSQASDRNIECFNARRVCPWGDYAGASPDPVADDTVWGSNQTLGPVSPPRCSGFPCPYWRTRNFELKTGP